MNTTRSDSSEKREGVSAGGGERLGEVLAPKCWLCMIDGRQGDCQARAANESMEHARDSLKRHAKSTLTYSFRNAQLATSGHFKRSSRAPILT